MNTLKINEVRNRVASLERKAQSYADLAAASTDLIDKQWFEDQELAAQEMADSMYSDIWEIDLGLTTAA